MSRNVPTNLGTHLLGECLTLAQLVKLVRADGEVFAFTSNNKSITYDGQIYDPIQSATASGQTAAVGSGVDNMEIVGLLSSDLITESDLLAGRFDGAVMTVYLVNYLVPADGAIILFDGWIGNVSHSSGQFTAELRSKSQKLSQQIGEVTTPTCRVKRLGDARCGVTIATYQHTKTVDSAVDARNMTFAADAAASGYYDYGLVTFDSDPDVGGVNYGLSREVKAHTLTGGKAVIELQEAFPYEPTAGDIAVLEAGCDRLLTTCNTTFKNVLNFRGEPHIPGTNALMMVGRGDAAYDETGGSK